jgi:hypothetical protein
MNKAFQKQVAALRKLASDKYEQDGGTTAETCDEQDLEALITEHGTAAKAFAWQVRIYEAGREAAGVNEAEQEVALFRAQEAAALAQVVAPAPAPAPVAVALRGGPAVAAVRNGPAPYRVKAAHNLAWWRAIQACLAEHGGTAPVSVVCEAAACPPTLLAYLLRRGHLAVAE